MVTVGQKIGRIRIQALIGQGGMGSVYQGFDETLGRQVALKSIRSTELSAERKARFLREARVLSRLDHPSICQIFDYLQDDEGDYLVLELIRGRTLGAAIDVGLDHGARVAIALEIGRVLVAAHAAGVIHRDLKPSNVMLSDDRRVKVLDFGLARPVDLPRKASRAGAPVPIDDEDPTLGMDKGMRPEDPGAAEADDTFAPPEPGTSGSSVDLGAGVRTLLGRVRAGAPMLGDVTLGMDKGMGPKDPGTEDTYASPDPGTSESSIDLGAGLRTRFGRVMGTPAYMSPEQARGEVVSAASDMFSFGLLLQNLWTARPPYGSDLAPVELLRRASRAEVEKAEGIDREVAALIGRLLDPAPSRRPTAVESVSRLEWIAGRRRRWLRRALAAVLVTIAILGALKYSVDLRHEREVADLRRAQAEDLLGFMLGNLEEKLSPLGRLDILNEIGDQAMKYYASVPPQELSPEEIFQRSEAMIQIGEIRLLEGDLEASLEAREEVLRLAEGLAERDPENVEWRTRLGAAHFWIGRIHWEHGDVDAALQRFESQMQITRELAHENPEDPDLQLEFAHSRTNVGFVQQVRGDIEGALVSFQSVLTTLEETMALRPDDSDVQLEYADQSALVGTLLWRLGEPGSAMEYYESGRVILEGLVDLPDNAHWQQRLAIVLTLTGRALMAAGDDRSRYHFQEALEIAEKLVTIEPTQVFWQQELGVALRFLALYEVSAGAPKAGLSHGRRAETVLKRVLDKQSTPAVERDLAMVRLVIGKALLGLEDPVGARWHVLSAMKVLEAQAAENPDDRDSRIRLADGLSLLASSERTPDAAQAVWERLLDLVEPSNGIARDLNLLKSWHRALENLGQEAESARVRALIENLSREVRAWSGVHDRGLSR